MQTSRIGAVEATSTFISRCCWWCTGGDRFSRILVFALIVLTGSAVTSLAQGRIVFANNPETTITNAITGDAWWGADPGLLRVAVYGANGENQPESSLALQLGAVTNLYAPGRFFGGTRVLALPPAPDRVTLQVRAWGASTFYETYEEAVVAGLAGDSSVVIGASVPFTSTLTIPLAPATPLWIGLQPFSVSPIPEPSGLALGLLGVGAFLLTCFTRPASSPN
jgi:hypothetical protein